MTRKRWHLIVVLGFLLVPCAHAGTILLTATAQGWMTATMNDGAYAANNYMAGNCGAGDCYTGEFRNFFQFAIPALNAPIVSATLLLGTSYEALQQSTSITYQVTSVGPDFGFSDLGTGTVYGSRTYTSADGYLVEGITLDANALQDLLQAAGGTFTVGGRVNSSVSFGASQPDELIFGRTTSPQQLRIVTGSSLTMLSQPAPAPEPAPALLLIAGGVLLLLRNRAASVRKRCGA